jgi:hypothetical protein
MTEKTQHKKIEKEIEIAKRLGVTTEDIFPTGALGASDIGFARLQERIRNAENTKYAKLTWIVALISAIASVISAAAAWLAIKINL